MTKKGLSGPWFCLLAVCFVVWPALALVPKPAQCLVSGVYDVTRQSEYKDGGSCWWDCIVEPDCHMAVVAKRLTGSDQCLLVNCLDRGKYSHIRDPSEQISVFPKNSTDDVQMDFLRNVAYGSADEKLRCWDEMKYSSCQSGLPKFFYNGTSFRCERFYSGCGSSRNMFDTQEACEALCNEKFRCYRPRHYGGYTSHFPKFFYNMSSQRCESFIFSGRGSNGNIFQTAEECERLCSGVTGLNPDTTTRQRAVDSVFVVVVLLLVALVAVVRCRRRSPSPTSISSLNLLPDPENQCEKVEED